MALDRSRPIDVAGAHDREIGFAGSSTMNPSIPRRTISGKAPTRCVERRVEFFLEAPSSYRS
jgi:hypothetical protein